MPIEIRELHIKAVVAPPSDELMLFQAADSAGKGGHVGGVNVIFADGSVRAADDDQPAFTTPEPEPVPTEIMSLNFEKISYATMGPDGLDLFG